MPSRSIQNRALTIKDLITIFRASLHKLRILNLLPFDGLTD